MEGEQVRRPSTAATGLRSEEVVDRAARGLVNAAGERTSRTLGEIVRVPVSPGSALDGHTLSDLRLELETGFYLLAIRRSGRYVYRPRGPVRLEAGDQLIASGPEEGADRLARLGGFSMQEDDATGEFKLIPLAL